MRQFLSLFVLALTLGTSAKASDINPVQDLRPCTFALGVRPSCKTDYTCHVGKNTSGAFWVPTVSGQCTFGEAQVIDDFDRHVSIPLNGQLVEAVPPGESFYFYLSDTESVTVRGYGVLGTTELADSDATDRIYDGNFVKIKTPCREQPIDNQGNDRLRILPSDCHIVPR